MDALRATYGDGDKDDKVDVPSDSPALPPPASLDGGTSGGVVVTDSAAAAAAEAGLVVSETKSGGDHAVGSKEELEAVVSENNPAPKVMENIQGYGSTPEDTPNQPPDMDGVDEIEGGEEEEEPPSKKQKQLSDLPEIGKSAVDVSEVPSPADAVASQSHGGKPPTAKTSKKSKKKSKDVWMSSSRKGKKKTKHASNNNLKSKNAVEGDASNAQKLVLAPVSRFPDRYDDSPDMKICLSKICKAEKVDLSEDRLEACSTKGYRMVRATRGVTAGAWYFEIKVDYLGETGHTRLGWSTEKADLQAPVGYDGNSYGYRDIDGSKVHKALREKYGDEGYKEGDVIGFYINLPDGDSYAPNRPRVVWLKGQRYVSAPDPEDVPKVVPGSEISYFKNGVCQGVAFTDLNGGRYYPAASMYTLPNELPCVVKFNFGPEFECFPEHFGERPAPKPMIEVPYQSYDSTFENGNLRNITRMPPMLRVIKEENKKILKDAEMVG